MTSHARKGRLRWLASAKGSFTHRFSTVNCIEIEIKRIMVYLVIITSQKLEIMLCCFGTCTLTDCLMDSLRRLSQIVSGHMTILAVPKCFP